MIQRWHLKKVGLRDLDRNGQPKFRGMGGGQGAGRGALDKNRGEAGGR